MTLPRARYAAELRAAIGRLLAGRREIALGELELELRANFDHDVPGRPTLAKAVAAAGWLKTNKVKPSLGSIYRAPKS